MSKGLPRTLTAAELRRLRAAVEAGDVPLSDITLRFGIGRKALRALIDHHGWQTGTARYRRPAEAAHGPAG